jgi:rod shape-determining protein MreC
LVVLFVVTSLTFISLDNRAALDPLKTGLREVTVPVTERLGGLFGGDDNSDLGRQLAQVQAERDAYLAENVKLKEEIKEVDQLKAQVKFQETHPEYTMVTARVINPDPTNLQKFITIDKGSADGIQIGMTVVDPNFYVGQVTKVEEHSSRVTLVIDSTARVGAQLQDNGAIGIVFGTWQSGGRAEMRHLDRGVKAKDGELVITATNEDVRTSRVPGNLVIGKVVGKPEVDNQTDTLTLQILPVVDFDKLKVVSIIMTDDSANS